MLTPLNLVPNYTHDIVEDALVDKPSNAYKPSDAIKVMKYEFLVDFLVEHERELLDSIINETHKAFE